MTFILPEILFINPEVMITIQLPESYIQNIKMLIWEIIPHSIDILLLAYMEQYIFEVWLPKLSEWYPTVIIHIADVENS